MTDVNAALDASKDAIEQLIVAGEHTGAAWTTPRAPGKWSPSQSRTPWPAHSRSRRTWRRAIRQRFPGSRP